MSGKKLKTSDPFHNLFVIKATFVEGQTQKSALFVYHADTGTIIPNKDGTITRLGSVYRENVTDYMRHVDKEKKREAIDARIAEVTCG